LQSSPVIEVPDNSWWLFHFS